MALRMVECLAGWMVRQKAAPLVHLWAVQMVSYWEYWRAGRWGMWMECMSVEMTAGTTVGLKAYKKERQLVRQKAHHWASLMADWRASQKVECSADWLAQQTDL